MNCWRDLSYTVTAAKPDNKANTSSITFNLFILYQQPFVQQPFVFRCGRLHAAGRLSFEFAFSTLCHPQHR